MLERADAERTPLQRQIDQLSRWLGIGVVVIGVVIIAAILVTSRITAAQATSLQIEFHDGQITTGAGHDSTPPAAPEPKPKPARKPAKQPPPEQGSLF